MCANAVRGDRHSRMCRQRVHEGLKPHAPIAAHCPAPLDINRAVLALCHASSDRLQCVCADMVLSRACHGDHDLSLCPRVSEVVEGRKVMATD